jgi:hypothetical protein
MAHLDVSPVLTALRTAPEEFELVRGCLYHRPSAHSFLLDPNGNVRLAANCNCASLAVRHEDGLELWRRFQAWQTDYWTPLTINREFASHFRPRSAVRQTLINLVERLHRALVDGGRRHVDRKAALQPAE